MEEQIEFEVAPEELEEETEATEEETSEEEMKKKKKKKKKEYPYPYEEDAEKLKARLENLEAQVAKILEILEQLKKEEEKTETKELKEEEEDVLKKAILDLKRQYEAMSKKIEKLEKTPVRLTKASGEADTNKRIEQFLSQVTGGEILVWAEKKGIKWGQGEV